MKKNFTMATFFILSLFVTNIILYSCQAAVEKNSANQNEESGEIPGEREIADEANDKSMLDDLGEYDFGGHEFKIFNRISDGWANCRLDFEELTGEVYQDAVNIRNRNLEDRFNIKIVMAEWVYSGQNELNKIKNMILSGDNEYDLYTCRGAESFGFAQQGLINGINELTNIDFSKTYWDDFLTNQLTILNRKYFAVGAFCTTFFDYAYVLVFNKQLLQNYGLENPFEVVKNGKWTYDKFAEMCKSGTIDLNGDGKMDANDAWGYCARSNDVLPGLWIAGGAKAAEKDGDDVPQNTMGTEKFLDVVDKIFQITHGNDIYYNSDKQDMFCSDKVLFNDVDLFMLKNLRAMETDFGILPYPKFDEKQEAYYTRLGGGDLFFTGITSTKEDLERTSAILEAMACDSLKTVVPAYYDIMLKTKLARDEESEEMIDYIIDQRVFDWVDVIWVSEIRDGPLNDMFVKKSNTLVSLNESKLTSIFDKKRDSMVEAFSGLEN
ncbi:MAG: ABC transporter substrate-binding protein [Oscillospiraceae bacterium]|nr:ABC transporter substrate-binding protein [Oscillospiraceae bacterium]